MELTTPETHTRPLKLGIYGQAGSGKSTISSRFPGAYCLNIDARIHKALKYKGISPQVRSFQEAMGYLRELFKIEDLKTLVIDDFDSLVSLEVARLMQEDPKAFTYGGLQASTKLDQIFSSFFKGLDSFLAADKNIILLMRADWATVRTDAEDFKTWDLSIYKSLKDKVKYYLDTILFIGAKQIAKEIDGGMSSRKIGHDRELTFDLICRPSSLHYAVKNGHFLPDRIEGTYSALSLELEKYEERAQTIDF